MRERERGVLRAQHQAAELRTTNVRDQENRHCKKVKIQKTKTQIDVGDQTNERHPKSARNMREICLHFVVRSDKFFFNPPSLSLCLSVSLSLSERNKQIQRIV